MTILVAYATRYGSTQEVAQAITEALRTHHLEVEMRPAREVRTLDGYSAVVLGAPLFMLRWHRDARNFLKQHRAALSSRPIAIFALGPLHNVEEELQGSRKQLDRALAKMPWLEPAVVEVFVGAIDPAKLHFPYNRMQASDARDWTAIRAWADRLAAMFRPAVLPT
jgi:menaquinone-dependent protoporphyrinogen oxidase